MKLSYKISLNRIIRHAVFKTQLFKIILNFKEICFTLDIGSIREFRLSVGAAVRRRPDNQC